MPIEDGIRKAAKNLDKAAEAAPTSEVADADKFGVKDKAAEAHEHTEDRAAGEEPTPEDHATGEDSTHDSED